MERAGWWPRASVRISSHCAQRNDRYFRRQWIRTASSRFANRIGFHADASAGGGFDVGPMGLCISTTRARSRSSSQLPRALLTVRDRPAGSTGTVIRPSGPLRTAPWLSSVNGTSAFRQHQVHDRVITAATGTIQTVAGAPHSSGTMSRVLAQIQLATVWQAMPRETCISG